MTENFVYFSRTQYNMCYNSCVNEHNIKLYDLQRRLFDDPLKNYYLRMYWTVRSSPNFQEK